MKFGMKQLFDIIGEQRSFDYEIPQSGLAYLKNLRFASPVRVCGRFFNRAGIVTMSYSVRFTLTIVCDRCLDEQNRDYCYDFQHIVVRSLSGDNDDYIVAQDDSVETDEIAVSDLLLQLPTKILCKEDCLGLCSRCGCNLNNSECQCRDAD